MHIKDPNFVCCVYIIILILRKNLGMYTSWGWELFTDSSNVQSQENYGCGHNFFFPNPYIQEDAYV